jgi:zinc/manganese transport system permease protein
VLELLGVPFLACLVLTGIHVYLGLHVLARGVIFVDLALAQVAALGISVAVLAGHAIQSEAAYWYALAFTMGGAGLFALSRVHRGPIPQEAIIGIVYAVSAAIAVLVVDRAPQGSEHIKQLLVGSILTVTPGEVATLTALYAAVGALHWSIRRPLLDISFDPDGAAQRGRAFRMWDFVFYTSFGFVVTSSVRLAGVLLVFSYLIVPAVVGALLARGVGARLLIGWGFGLLVSVLGLLTSWSWDLPTGAAIVTTFGALLAAIALALAARAGARGVRAQGLRALTGVGIGAAGLLGLIGLLVLAFPAMDHPWLDWLEEAVPAVRRAFLDADEREADAESRAAIAEGLAELARVRQIQQDAQWGTRPLSDEMQERVRQYIAGRRELVTGDRLVLRALTQRVRERQRYVLGVPLVVVGAALVALGLRHRRCSLRPLPGHPGSPTPPGTVRGDARTAMPNPPEAGRPAPDPRRVQS